MAGRNALPGPVVTTPWLAERLGADDLMVLDATVFLPNEGRDGDAEYRQAHIPGAIRFDVDRVRDESDPRPHMLPPPAGLGRHLGALGIGDGVTVIAYDGRGVMGAARAWWMLRIAGHDQVAVLDGGLPRWRADGRPVEAGWVDPRPRPFTVRFRPELVADADQVAATLAAGGQVVDARSAGRFAGTEPEPRPSLPSGHMPGARSLPFGQLAGADGLLLAPAALRERFAQAGIDLDRPVTATCGSGVSACVLALGAAVAGAPAVTIYDGSWADWASQPGRPIATGA